MRKTVEIIALKIALIQREFSERDIRDAVLLLSDSSDASALLKYLSQNAAQEHSNREAARPNNIATLTAGMEPGRLEVFKEIEQLVQGGSLPKLEHVRDLGQSISKDFTPKKSRKDTVRELLRVIAQQPLEIMQKLLEELKSASRSKTSEGYQDLARFIITGRDADKSDK